MIAGDAMIKRGLPDCAYFDRRFARLTEAMQSGERVRLHRIYMAT